jgi:hypothetical protein
MLFLTHDKAPGLFFFVLFVDDYLLPGPLPSVTRGAFSRDRPEQRVLNELWRARLSRSRMIWLLAHPLNPSSVSKLARRHTIRLRKTYQDNLRGGKAVGEEPNLTTARKLGPL